MILKRIFDISFSAILLVLLIPIFVIIAIAIKVESSGPILFAQERVGKKKKLFVMHKFRSMRFTADNNGPLLTVGRDTRITRVGSVIRKLKIDELPQIFDILVGHMSFVGPRPEVPKYVQHYTLQQKQAIFSIRPGLTDMASVLYIDEAEILGSAEDPEEFYINQILPIKLELAIDYINNRSFLYDMKIMVKTIKKIMFR